MDRTRGLLSLPERVAAAYPEADPRICASTSITPNPYAFQLARGAVFCGEATEPWGGRFPGPYVYFDPSVSEAKALKILRRLLPADARQTLKREGHNQYWSSKPEASCMTFYFTSKSLVPIRNAIQVSDGLPDAASFTLYTDFWEISEGAGAPYDPKAVTFASVFTSDWTDEPGC